MRKEKTTNLLFPGKRENGSDLPSVTLPKQTQIQNIMDITPTSGMDITPTNGMTTGSSHNICDIQREKQALTVAIDKAKAEIAILESRKKALNLAEVQVCIINRNLERRDQEIELLRK